MAIPYACYEYKQIRFRKTDLYKYLENDFSIPKGYMMDGFMEDPTNSSYFVLIVKNTESDSRAYRFLKTDFFAALRDKFKISSSYKILDIYDEPGDDTFYAIRIEKT